MCRRGRIRLALSQDSNLQRLKKTLCFSSGNDKLEAYPTIESTDRKYCAFMGKRPTSTPAGTIPVRQ